MTLWELAARIFDAAESTEVPHMAVGAIAVGAHGIPRATRDIDLLVSIDSNNGVHQLIRRLESFIEFEPQAQFATITWGCRHVGIARTPPPFKVELFEIFDDPFVISEFSERELWLQSAEDLVIQKLGGHAQKIWKTHSTLSPCKLLGIGTWPTSNIGAPSTAPPGVWKPSSTAFLLSSK